MFTYTHTHTHTHIYISFFGPNKSTMGEVDYAWFAPIGTEDREIFQTALSILPIGCSLASVPLPPAWVCYVEKTLACVCSYTYIQAHIHTRTLAHFAQSDAESGMFWRVGNSTLNRTLWRPKYCNFCARKLNGSVHNDAENNSIWISREEFMW
jgi:hypothetical protein